MFLPGCDAILDSSMGVTRARYTSQSRSPVSMGISNEVKISARSIYCYCFEKLDFVA